jgi:hypothetical protein
MFDSPQITGIFAVLATSPTIGMAEATVLSVGM